MFRFRRTFRCFTETNFGANTLADQNSTTSFLPKNFKELRGSIRKTSNILVDVSWIVKNLVCETSRDLQINTDLTAGLHLVNLASLSFRLQAKNFKRYLGRLWCADVCTAAHFSLSIAFNFEEHL